MNSQKEKYILGAKEKGAKVPDELLPYCRELYDRIWSDTNDDSRKRAAAVWVLSLVRMSRADADKVIMGREQGKEWNEDEKEDMKGQEGQRCILYSSWHRY